MAWICPLELREVPGVWMKAVYCNQRNWDTKALCPEASQGPAWYQFATGDLATVCCCCCCCCCCCVASVVSDSVRPRRWQPTRQEHWSGLPLPAPMHACMLSRFSRVWLYVTLWTAAHLAPLSTRFSRQEYWSGLPLPSPVNSMT